MAVKWIFLWMGPGLSKAENLKNERIANVFEDCESTREVRNNPVSKRSKISFDPNVIVLHR